MSFEMTTLGEYIKVQGGYAYKSKDFIENSANKVLKIKNVRFGTIDYSEPSYVSDEIAEATKNWKVSEGDVLISMTGSGPNAPQSLVGRVARVWKNEPDAWINQRVGRVCVLDEDIVHLDFIFYWLSLPQSQEYLVSNSSGSANQANISGKIIESLPCPKVDYQTSKQIADLARNFDEKIILNSQTNQTLEQMAQAIFKSWFVDFDPVKAKMNGEQPEGMDAATASLFPEKLVESELGLIPEGWEAKLLGDYLTIKRGGSPRPIKDFIVPDGYPWTKIADATANDNPYIFKTKEFIKEEGLKKTVYLKRGTLILSNSATPGLPRFLELDACIHDGWLHFPEKKHFTDSYLYQLFLHIRKHLVSQGNGSVFTNLKTDILRNQIVLVPPKELVDIYEKHAGKLLETVKAKSIESNQLAQLRDTLLPKLLSGEIELAETTI